MAMREDESNASVPRGGPIYMPNLVGPLTRVPEFHSSLLHLLQDLEAELRSDCSSISQDDDISIDGLKIYTEEELTDMAMKEAFRDQDNSENNSKEPSNKFHQDACNHKDSSDKNVDLDRTGRADDVPASFECSREHPSRDKRRYTVLGLLAKIKCRDRRRKKKKRSTETRTKAPNDCFDEAFLAKVDQIAKIKERQDEDKLAVRLHCLNSTFKNTEGDNPSSEGIKRMKSLKSTNYATKPVFSSDVQAPATLSSTEIVLCIEIYHATRKSLKTQEFLVLGHQTLTEFRDKIQCVTDQVMKKAGQYDPSGYFLIEDIFCNDLRDPSSIDYSKPILDWLRDSKDEALRKWESLLTGELLQKQKAVLGEAKATDLPRFKSVDMHRIQFSDLRFQLGAGYVYCHQGDCKHMMVIRDMRLIHPEDSHNRAAYPMVIFQHKPLVEKCSVCKIYRASKLTVDDKWAKENPCYFCDSCFALLHSHDGPLSCHCPVFDYVHD